MWLLEVVVFLLGVIYGFLNPGKEDRWKLFKNAIKIGVALGIVMGIVFVLLLMPLGLVHPIFPIAGLVVGVIWEVVTFVILTAYFAMQ